VNVLIRYNKDHPATDPSWSETIDLGVASPVNIYALDRDKIACEYLLVWQQDASEGAPF
jgi:hypothetical protein